MNNKSILGYQGRSDVTSRVINRGQSSNGSPKYANNRSILDEGNILSMGARMIEINAGDKLLKDFKDRTKNKSNIQITQSQPTRGPSN